jgi:hypothetical protein
LIAPAWVIHAVLKEKISVLAFLPKFNCRKIFFYSPDGSGILCGWGSAAKIQRTAGENALQEPDGLTSEQKKTY